MAHAHKPAVLEELLRREDADRLEIICGEIVEKASPSPRHSRTTRKLGAAIDPFDRKPGGVEPGGWWLFTEIHVGYAHGHSEVYCHDAAGWRRDRSPTEPAGWPVRLRPDWVCESVSPKHQKRDLVDKPRVLHAAEVPHYWTIDPEDRVLIVHRWSRDGYVAIRQATAGETIRAEPFDAIEIKLGVLFGDEDD
ncbi:MAG TPA: Uma2 family endonuclease [Kofleriaceae bacterium]|nr:Uma2 family endonuclease [Kofleriaceae bacterium]